MSTRVIQLSKFASGFRDPVTDVVLAGGSANFYVADGTYSVLKNAYADILKASSITGVTLTRATTKAWNMPMWSKPWPAAAPPKPLPPTV